jgi:hypothetical protein
MRAPLLRAQRPQRQPRDVAIDPDGAEEKRAVSNEHAEYLAELAPNAVEVRGHDDRRHYWIVTAADGSTHTFVCIAKSDYHLIEAMSDPKAVTHVKLSRRDITCVRAALTRRRPGGRESLVTKW